MSAIQRNLVVGRRSDLAVPAGQQATTSAAARNDRHGSADDCFEAMVRHHARLRQAAAVQAAPTCSEFGPGRAAHGEETGDIIYGAKAIALFIFGDDSNRARRRVFNLWAHYRDRKESAGFLKLNGAVCLSRRQWRAFHGLG